MKNKHLYIILPLSALLLLPSARSTADRKLSLEEAIRLARKDRSEATQAEIERQRADLNVLRARLERVRLVVQANASEQWQKLQVQLTGPEPASTAGDPTTVSLEQNEAHRYGFSADLTVPIWSGFQIEADVSRARFLGRVAEAQQKGTARTIALDVARAYWGVRRTELLRDVQAQAVERDDEIEKITQARVRSGIAPQVDFNRARAGTLREQAQLAALDAQVAEARAQLAAVLQIDEGIALTEDPTTHKPVLPPLALAVDAARAQRPELVLANAQLLAQQEAVRSARGAYWPRIELFAHADVANSPFLFASLTTEDLLGNFYAGARLQWILFDTLTTWATVRDAEYQRSRLAADEVRARFLVDADVKATHARLTQRIAQNAISTQAAQLSRDNLTIIRKRYEAGDALVIELLDAQLQLLRAESDLVDNQVSIAQADAELKAALGQL